MGRDCFEKDSALANTRRLHRSQRRHVRATRQRIARMEKLLVHLGIFTEAELKVKHVANGGNPTAWLLAARVLASDGQQTLTWPELWDVLRWYAHNRGYEEITGETRDPHESVLEEKKKDAEKVANAKAALAKYGKSTMAETICAWLGQDPLATRAGTTASYKANNCAFERPVVVAEVARILAAHRGKLPHVDEPFIAALTLDARAISVPSIRLPKRFDSNPRKRSGLLFGRLATRYHNRIIGHCPISGEKIPNKNCPEFLRYRWAMNLRKITVTKSAGEPSRSLNMSEIGALTQRMKEEGRMTAKEFIKVAREIGGFVRDNLEQTFMEATADDDLVLDPIQALTRRHKLLAAVWSHLPPVLQVRTRGHLRRGKSTTLAKLREETEQCGHDCTAFDHAVEVLCAPPAKKSKKQTPPPTREDVLGASIDIRRDLAKLSGRAPYARPLLAKAFEEVMAGRDPKAAGGCLEETNEVRRRRESSPITDQTNNQLLQHRLIILGGDKRARDPKKWTHGLIDNLVRDFAGGDAQRITRMTIEVNRDLRDMAGLSAQDLAMELGKRLSDHKHVAAYLEEKLPSGTPITAGLIRKARIADDLGWQCPYTGAHFEPVDLITRRVDKDHIIPRVLRQSDSLESLVITFSEVNRMKGKRTALQFVKQAAARPVEGLPNLFVTTPDRFEKFALAHAPKSDPRRLAHARGERVNEDDLRCWRRAKLMLTENYDEADRTFTPGQLTQTSQLARLGAQTVRQALPHLEPHHLVALPGSVTGAVRKAWNVLGCLATAAPGVMEKVPQADGSEKTEVRNKTEIRNITHLHHALDACVLALAAHFIPNRGNVWRLLVERRLHAAQQAELAALGLFDFDERGHFCLRDLAPELKEQIRQKLTERRVVQHVPADMSGMKVKQNIRGIIDQSDPHFVVLKPSIGDDGTKQKKPERVLRTKLLGLNPGKLAALNGVQVLKDNFGVAVMDDKSLAPQQRFVVIPHISVWRRVRELTKANGGKKPLILRKGHVVEFERNGETIRLRLFGAGLRPRGMNFDAAPVDALERATEISPATLIAGNVRLLAGSLCRL